MKITVKQIMSWKPCSEYPIEKVKRLVGNGKTALEICVLDIPAVDILWVLLRSAIVPEIELHELGCKFAESILKAESEAGREPQIASWEAIKIKRQWIKGQATTAQLLAAELAAWSAAAWSAAESAAAWSAGQAAESAAESAGQAAGQAAWSAAESAKLAAKLAAWSAAGQAGQAAGQAGQAARAAWSAVQLEQVKSVLEVLTPEETDDYSIKTD